MDNFKEVFKDGSITTAYVITIARTVIGTFLSLMVTTLAGYALKQEDLPGRKIITMLITFTMLLWWYDPYLYSVQKLTPVKLFLGLRGSESGERYLSVDGTNLLRRNPGQPGRVSQTGRLRILSDLPENHASVK